MIWKVMFYDVIYILASFYLRWFILLNKTRSLLFLTLEIERLLMVGGLIRHLFVKINSGQNIRTTIKMIVC
jgi:hypothetical protein